MSDNNQDNNKVDKAYNNAMSKMVAILNGEAIFKPVKVQKTEVETLVEALLKERKEKVAAEFKSSIIALLDSKQEFDKEVRKLEEEFKNKVASKKKEFTEKMNQTFKMVEKIEEIEKDYLATLGDALPKTEDNATSDPQVQNP